MMNNKDYFIQILRSTGREGVDEVIAGLEALGFFEAPASTVFHLNEPGGLLQHSLNVYREAMAIREKQIEMLPDIEPRLPADSVAIGALLHDTCKAAIYKPVEKWRKDAQGRWESYRGYEVDYSDLPVGHGEKSVIMLLRWGLRMTDDEILAIRWHMDAGVSRSRVLRRSPTSARPRACALYWRWSRRPTGLPHSYWKLK